MDGIKMRWKTRRGSAAGADSAYGSKEKLFAATAYVSSNWVAERDRFSGLEEKFYRAGPGRASARGDLEIRNCPQVADFSPEMHPQVVLGLRSAPGAAEAEVLVETAVGIFLKGVAAY